MSQNIFRESALERLSSPEQLDQLMRITSPRGWMSLAALGLVLALAIVWSFLGRVATTTTGQGIIIRAGGTFSVPALSAGEVGQVLVRRGDHIKAGQVVAKLTPVPTSDASGPPTASDVVSPYDAEVLETLVDRGDVVQPGARILNVEIQSGPDELAMFLPAVAGKQVRPGMPVEVSPSTAPPDNYGFLLGKVKAVSPFPSTEAGMLRLLDNQSLVQRFVAAAGDAPIEVDVALTLDAGTPSGYKWSSSKGPSSPITSGTLATAQVVLGQQRPISLVLPVFR